jgi:hypothetical protein
VGSESPGLEQQKLFSIPCGDDLLSYIGKTKMSIANFDFSLVGG